jgi:hypothetical protein
MGHVLGIESSLIARTMPQAAALFKQMQTAASEYSLQPDPRPKLDEALMNAMAAAIKIALLHKLPVPMKRWLMGMPVAQAPAWLNQIEDRFTVLGSWSSKQR